MHLQAYQINNVLNVFRKQLRQKTKSWVNDAMRLESTNMDKLADGENQRRFIIDQISADIVRRMAQSIQPDFEDTVDEMAEAAAGDSTQNLAAINENEFIYTIIDENNNKQTQVMQINGTGSLQTGTKQTPP